ncbi:MAG: hypothetical protein ABJE95_03435 [Byssovorax sp.]
MTGTRLDPRWSLLSIPAIFAFAGCKPDDPPPVPTTPPAVVTTAPCKAALVTDTFTADGIDTRTGCLLVTMTLGSAAGASDLSLTPALVRSEGNVPPATLYPAPWFGAGVWLSLDEYLTNDGDKVLTLHTPNGDVVYDQVSAVPDATELDPSDDRNTKLWKELRTRPFDGTFLWWDKTGYTITVGNPGDSRSLTKKYQTALPNDPGSDARLLTRVEKASIYKGRRNSIDIKRTYTKEGLSVELSSSLFEGSGLKPLVISAPLPRADGLAGYQIGAVTTLLHGWSSAVTAVVSDQGHIEQVISRGRNADDIHQTSFTYFNAATPATTVVQSIVEQEGPQGDPRTQRSIELKDRAAAASPTWPFAVTTIIDHARPGADLTDVMTECPRQQSTQSNTKTLPTYFTYNSADGTSAAWEYADADTRGMLVRSKDAVGQETFLEYNLARGGGTPNNPQPATAFELKFLTTRNGTGKEQLFMYRFDRFSANVFGLPMIGKVSIPKAVGDKQVISRSVFGERADPQNGGRFIRTFDVPRGVAGPDGRTRWEYRGIDGFTYETWDEDGVMLWFRWIDQDKSADGTYDKETIDTYLMGVKQSRSTRDRFGRLLSRVDFDPALPANKQPTTTFNLTKDGFTDRIDDSATGESYNVKAWNGPRTAVTSSTLERAGQKVITLDRPADDLGNPEGAGTVTLGPVKITTSTERLGGGLLKSSAITGPNGRALKSELAYAPKDAVPNQEKLNGKRATAVTPRSMTAKGGCQ